MLQKTMQKTLSYFVFVFHSHDEPVLSANSNFLSQCTVDCQLKKVNKSARIKNLAEPAKVWHQWEMLTAMKHPKLEHGKTQNSAVGTQGRISVRYVWDCSLDVIKSLSYSVSVFSVVLYTFYSRHCVCCMQVCDPCAPSFWSSLSCKNTLA